MTQPTNQAGEVFENAKAYRAIKAKLLTLIGSKWAAGQQLPPIKDLARELGSGQSNTHLAVKELVSEGLLVSRAGQGTFVVDPMTNIEWTGTKASEAGDSPAPGRQIAGAIIEILTSGPELRGFLQTVVDAAQQVFLRANCKITRSYTGTQHPRVSRHPSPGTDGQLVLNWDETTPIEVLPDHPMVCLSTTASVRILATGGYDVVMADSEQGGYLAGDHLKKAGCDSVCFLGVSLDGVKFDHTSQLRLEGFEAGFGRKLTPGERVFATNYATTAGAVLVQKFLAINPRPAGVFAASDDIAVGFVHGALAHGIHAGRDFLLVGFDGQERGRQLPTGALTTAGIPAALMGKTAANFLITRMAYPDTPVRRLQLGCSLFVGATTQRVG